jgi:hypothetical protein
MFVIGTPSHNLSMARWIQKNENLAKKQWSSKRPKLKPTGQKPLQHEHIPLFASKLNSNKDKRMGPLKENHHLNKGGPMVKQLLRLVHATNALPKAPFNHPKETSLTKY